MDQGNEVKGDRASYWRLKEFAPNEPESVLERLRIFHLELLKFNKKINLISKRTELDADLVHFTDCLKGSRLLLDNTKALKIYDIGSGNGLPGLILALLAPERQFVLIDSDARKVEFLKHIVDRLGLTNTLAEHKRVEDLPADSIECAVSRGFAQIGKAILICRAIFKKGGEYFHLKGSIWPNELAAIPSQVCSIWEPGHVGDYELPKGYGTRTLVITKRL